MRTKKYDVELPKIKFEKIIFLIFLVTSLYFFISNAIIRPYVINKEVKELEKKLDKLEKENSMLRKELYSIQSDTSTIEYYVRKELGLIKQGEKILVLKRISDNNGLSSSCSKSRF